MDYHVYHIYVGNREALFDRVLVAFSEKIGTSTYSCIWNASVRCKCCHCLETLFVDKHYNREVSNNDFFSLEGVKIEIRFCSTCDCICFWWKIQAFLRVKFQGDSRDVWSRFYSIYSTCRDIKLTIGLKLARFWVSSIQNTRNVQKSCLQVL